MVVRSSETEPWQVVGQEDTKEAASVDIESKDEKPTEDVSNVPAAGEKRERSPTKEGEPQAKRARVSAEAETPPPCLAPPQDPRISRLLSDSQPNTSNDDAPASLPGSAEEYMGCGDVFLTEGWRDRWCHCKSVSVLGFRLGDVLTNHSVSFIATIPPVPVGGGRNIRTPGRSGFRCALNAVFSAPKLTCICLRSVARRARNARAAAPSPRESAKWYHGVQRHAVRALSEYRPSRMLNRVQQRRPHETPSPICREWRGGEGGGYQGLLRRADPANPVEATVTPASPSDPVYSCQVPCTVEGYCNALFPDASCPARRPTARCDQCGSPGAWCLYLRPASMDETPYTARRNGSGPDVS